MQPLVVLFFCYEIVYNLEFGYILCPSWVPPRGSSSSSRSSNISTGTSSSSSGSDASTHFGRLLAFRSTLTTASGCARVCCGAESNNNESGLVVFD